MFRHIVFSHRNIYEFGEWILVYAVIIRQSFGRAVTGSAGLPVVGNLDQVIQFNALSKDGNFSAGGRLHTNRE